MSAFSRKAELIQEGLEALPELCDIDIIVDRNMSVMTQIKEKMGKVKGRVVIIQWEGHDIDDNLCSDFTKVNMSVSVIMSVDINSSYNEIFIDDLTECISKYLIKFEDQTLTARTNLTKINVSGIRKLPPINDPKVGYLIGYQILCSFGSNLNK